MTILPCRRDNLGKLAAVAVLVLAFLLAAAPLRQSEFWLHLASGKAMAQGWWDADPFTYTSFGGEQLNHSWLYEILTYGLFSAVGATGLALLNSFAIAALAGMLIVGGSTGRGFLLPALTTALSLIALGPWLTSTPFVFSLFAAALTLLLLERYRRRPVPARGGMFRTALRYWPFLVLFAVWANMDRWFVVGPMLVAGYLVGCSWSGWAGSGAPSKTSFTSRIATKTPLLLALLAGVAACAISPFGIQNLEMPPQLLANEGFEALQEDACLREMFLAPFEDVYSPQILPTHPAGLAYWGLAMLGLISFGLNLRAWRGERLLIFFGCFALSLWLNLAVALFALVAAPVVALNLGEARRKAAVQATRYSWRPAFGLGGATISVALIPLCWNGFLHPGVMTPAWTAEIDPSLVQAAGRIATWRREGKMSVAARCLNLSPEQADIFAWLCPEERGFVTSHLALSADGLREYAVLREALRMPERTAPPGWRDIMRRRRIDHVVVGHRDFLASLRKIVAAPDEWALLYVGGTTVIAGWRDPEKPTDHYHGLEVDLDRQAFGAGAAGSLWAATAPGSAVWQTPQRRHTFQRAQARTLLNLALLLRPHQYRKNVSLAAASAAGNIPVSGASLTPLHLNCLAPYAVFPAVMGSRDNVPAAAVYLALGATHRAIEAAPHDGRNYELLTVAHAVLQQDCRDRLWTTSFPHLERLRAAQSMAAWFQAARLQPNSAELHLHLGETYFKRGFQDLGLKHLEIARQVRGQKLLDNFFGPLDLIDNRLADFTRQVKDALRQHEGGSRGLPALASATRAGELGLAAKALEILCAADTQALGKEGLLFRYNLLLEMGRADEARSATEPAQLKVLGSYEAHWIRARAEAACGNFAAADWHLQQMTSGPDAQHAFPNRGELLDEEAKIWTLRGLLALEARESDDARDYFLKALAFWESPVGTPFVETSSESLAARALARSYLDSINQNSPPLPIAQQAVHGPR